MNPYINIQHTDVFNTLTVNCTLVTSGTAVADSIQIDNIPSLTVSTTADIGTEIRFSNNTADNVTVNTGSGILFVRVHPDTYTTPLAKMQRAAALLTAFTSNGVSVTCTAHGTDDDAYLVIKPRNTTVNWTGSTFDTPVNWEGSIVAGTVINDNSYKIYTDPREITMSATGVITATDSNGATITHASGDTLTVKSGTSTAMLNDEDALPAYTKA